MSHRYKHLFGPVPSRRLGISLGVDLVPHKTCTLNCIYCECGPTTNWTLQLEEYVPTKVVINELTDYLNTSPELDYVTFSGAGEPTLHSDIGTIVSFVKTNYPQYKLALITNGTLFCFPEVREQVKSVDLVLPSLDTVTDRIFKKINRPVSGLSVKSLIDGLVEFQKIYSGEMWLEIFIVPGINDQVEEITALRNVIKKIAPDKVQLNTMDRPGTVKNLRAATETELQRIAGQLGGTVEIIAKFEKRKDVRSYKVDIENAILQTISRRPCTLEDLSSILGLHINELNKYLNELLKNNRIISEKMDRGTFYRTTT